MAKGINLCLFLGNTGRDPEVRQTAGGTLVASFSLAIPDRRKENGEWKETTEWVNCIAFGRTAEIVRDYVPKGTKVHVSGKMQTRSWDDKESGQKRHRTEVLVNELTLLGRKPEGSGARTADADPNEVPGYAYTRTVEPVSDDDIPF